MVALDKIHHLGEVQRLSLVNIKQTVIYLKRTNINSTRHVLIFKSDAPERYTDFAENWLVGEPDNSYPVWRTADIRLTNFFFLSCNFFFKI